MRAASAAVSDPSSSTYIDQYNQYILAFGQGAAVAAALADSSAARSRFRRRGALLLSGPLGKTESSGDDRARASGSDAFRGADAARRYRLAGVALPRRAAAP